jgi:hypothetical protein
MKFSFTIIALIILTFISVQRVIASDSLSELIMAIVFAGIFFCCTIYLIFEDHIIKTKRFRALNKSCSSSNTCYYLVILFGLILFEIILFYFTPYSYISNYLKIFLSVFFGFGILLILIQLVKL